MASRLRWGILATGRIAASFVEDLKLVGSEVTAVGSREMERARRLASEHGIDRAHGSYEDLVTDPNVDVVYVATPNTSHASDALLAIDAGKHVLVEKPFALNAAEAQIVVDRAAELGLVVLEAMWTRWMPHMQRIRELVRTGGLGEVRSLIADHGLRLPGDPSHRAQNPSLGGGALLDLGIYPISFAWDLFGAPERILAMSAPTPTGVDAITSVILGFSGGQQAITQSVLDARTPITASVNGTDARIQIDSFWYFPNSFTVIDPAGHVIERFEHPVPGRGMQFQALELERLVTENRIAGDILPPTQSVAIMATLDEVRRQIRLNLPGDDAGPDMERSSAHAVGVRN